MQPLQDPLAIQHRTLDVEDYIDVVRRHRSLILAPMLAGLVISVVVAFLWPDTYVSSATIRVLPPQIPEGLLSMPLSMDMSQRVNQMTQSILSRATLINIINTHSLYPRERKRLPIEDIIEDMRSKAIDVNLIGGGGTNQGKTMAFTVSFKYENRVIAQRVCADLVTKFIDENVRERASSSSQMKDFVEDQWASRKRDLDAVEEQLEAIDWLFDSRASRPAYRAFMLSRIAPIAQRLGWEAKPGEADNDAVLRRSVLTTLGNLGHPATVGEARRRFDRYLADPSTLTGAGRRTVLVIVAANADTATWEALHQQAKASKDITDRARLYRYLGSSQDPVLAERTLKLALSGEPSPTETPGIIAAVSGVFPDMAYDFALANRAKVEGLLEPTQRSGFFPQLATTSRDPAMLDKLTRYIATIPASSKGEVDKALGSIRVRLGLIKDRVPEMERWLAANGAEGY